MTTVRQLINGSLRLLGVLAQGENATADQADEALTALNAMIGVWNASGIFVYTINRTTFTLTPNTQSYTLSSGGTLNLARPAKLERASIIPVATPSAEIPIPIYDYADWQGVTVKSVTSAFPTCVYDDGNYPSRNLSFWPIPTTACTFVLYSWGRLSSFTSLTEEISLPPEYERTVRYGLAVELAPEYGIEPAPTIKWGYAQNIKILQSINRRTLDITFDPALTSGNNNLLGVKSRGYVID